MERTYPHFPSDQELNNHILSICDLSQLSNGGKLSLLPKFILEPQLFSGETLLPDLIELYQWFHIHFAYLLTYNRASSISVGKIIELAEKRLSQKYGSHIRKLYNRVKLKFNKYMELVGGPDAAKERKQILDNTPLICFLTGRCILANGYFVQICRNYQSLCMFADVDEVKNNRSSNDWFYSVIVDIIDNHNQTIENLYSMVQSSNASLARLIPERPPRILPTEVNSQSAFVNGYAE